MTKTTITTIAVSILALIVAVVVLIGHGSPAVKVGAVPQGSLIDQDIRIMPYGYEEGIAGNANRAEYAIQLNLGSRSNQAYWLNNTGQAVLVGDFQGYLTGTASSTLAAFVGTSTKSTVTDSSAPIYGSILDTVLIATSTPAANIVLNSDVKGGTNGTGWVYVANNQYVVFALENPYNQACTGSVCETATSSNRGYNVNATALVHAF